MPPRARKTSDELAETSENLDTSTTKEITGVGTFYEGFDVEEFPEAVSVGEGELLVFKILDSNWVPMEQKDGEVVDTEVNQIVVLDGTTATEKVLEGTDWVSTGELISVGEVRSFWINSKLLRDAWDLWSASIDDEGAVKFGGKTVSKRKRDYQKWFVKFNKDKPRRGPATR